MDTQVENMRYKYFSNIRARMAENSSKMQRSAARGRQFSCRVNRWRM